MPTLLGANTLSSGYDVANSCRFNADAYMVKDIVTPTNQKKYTISVWVKRSKLTSRQRIFTVIDTSSTAAYSYLEFQSDDKLNFDDFDGSSTRLTRTTNAVFRDPSAWMNIIIAVDTTQSTGSNRVKMYINGTQVSSFGTETNASQNFDTTTLNSNKTFRVGEHGTAGFRFAGYMCEFVLIDGSQLDQTSFGEFDSDSPTLWKPIDVSGLTFGNNGFYLDFEDSSNLGNDVNGGTDLTETSLAATDQSTDTCTNNFCTLNPLYKQDHTFSEGNLGYTSSASDWDSAPGTISVSSGKWYVEMKVTGDASGVTRSVLGLCDVRDANLIAEAEFGITSSLVGDDVGYSNGAVHKGSSDQGGSFANYAVDDIIGMYADIDNGKVYFSKNGAMQNSGDPTSGSTGTGAISITTGQTYLFGATAYGGGASQMNFGSPPYAVSSGNADPNGYGNFEYGTQNYYALNTKNLAEFG